MPDLDKYRKIDGTLNKQGINLLLEWIEKYLKEKANGKVNK